MPKASNKQQKEISKQFWQYLRSKNLKPETKLELRQLYYNDFKKSLPSGSPSLAFSSVLYHLKRMKKLTKGEQGSILYYERKGRRMVIAMDQNYVQRRKIKLAENDQVTEISRNQGFLDELKKAFVANK